MENRFGFKDFVLIVLLLVLIVAVWLGMVQSDRQWNLLQTLQRQTTDQTRKLSAIQRAIEDGITVNSANPNSSATQATGSSAHGDPFGNLKDAEKHPDFARGDWMIDNCGAKLKKITPIVGGDLYADWVAARIVEGLIYRDPDTLQYRPQLARDWEVSEDGMVITFRLRKDVFFSDGEPFTADDVIYTFNLIMNEKVAADRQRAYYKKVKSVEKHGDYEVVFKMAEPYFEVLDLCGTMQILPKHFYEKYTEEQFNTNPGLIMGTGPYKVRDPAGWRPGQKVELIRNESYWGEAPTFNRIIFLEVEEEAAEETMFGNGELDVFATQPEQYQRLLKDPKTMARASHYEFDSPMNGYYFIAWNEKHNGQPTHFNDPRVRKAMTLLTDRDRINKEIYLGYATTISGPFAAGSPQADPAIAPLPFDPAAAKKLLADAGYHEDGGAMIGPDGKALTVKITYPNKNATFERVMLFIKDTYAQGGVTVELDPLDWPQLQKKLDGRDFDAISLGWGGSIESDLYQEFDSSQMADQGDNFMSYSNPEFDTIIRKARAMVDVNKRMELWHQAHRIFHTDQPYTLLCSRMSLRFMDKRIQNVRRSKIGLNYVYLYTMPNPWYVPRPMQKYAE